MADKLASLRAPLLADGYDAWKILGLARSVNATLGLYAQTIPALETCADADDLATRMASLASSVRRQVSIVLKAGMAVSGAPRLATVALYELLPEVIAISEEAKVLADHWSLDIAVAVVPEGSGGPLGPLAPLPTATTPPTVFAVKASFFGSGVTLHTYTVQGDTPSEISRSMSNRGPYNEWVGGRVDGLTQAKPAYRFAFGTNTSGSCSILPTDSPAITIEYTVTLPKWSAPSGASSATMEWWHDLLLEIATHERRHITIYRGAVKDLNSALASSTCGNYKAKLTAVWDDTNRDQCEFDMKEYGYAIGLSLEECVAQ